MSRVPGRMAFLVVGSVWIAALLAFTTATVQGQQDCDPSLALPGATEGPDVIIGTPGDDVIVGLGGGDDLRGLGGNDLICGGGGGDRIDGEQGNDTLVGEADGDELIGDAGNDDFDGGAGFDQVNFAFMPGPIGVSVDLAAQAASGEGADTLVAIEGVLGSPFADTLSGDDGVNNLSGMNGADRLDGRGDGDTVDYSNDDAAIVVSLEAGQATDGWGWIDELAGIEYVDGSPFDDLISGDAGSNVLNGLGGDDRIAGRAGVDTLQAGNGNDALFGGAGQDYDANATEMEGVEVDLAAGYARTLTGGSADRLTGIEGAFGSPQDDVLLGDANENEFVGLGGNDSVDGRGGVDLAGFDVIQDGRLVPGDGSVTVDLSAGVGSNELDPGRVGLRRIEGLLGSDEADELIGSERANLLIGGGGDDVLDGLGGDDAFNGGPGDDEITGGRGNGDFVHYAFDQIPPSGGDDLASTTAGIEADLSTGAVAVGDDVDSVAGLEILFGSPFADTIRGGQTSIFVRGTGGDDNLLGGRAGDTLFGGAGADAVDGGAGRDHCIDQGAGNRKPCESKVAPPAFRDEARRARFFLEIDLRNCRGNRRCPSNR